MKPTSSKVCLLKKTKAQSVLELSHIDARKFFLKPDSYTNIDLPNYIQFENMLNEIEKLLRNEDIKSLIKSVRNFENVNHSMLSNKDGRHAWRPLQLIHPVLYVCLVSQITDQQHWQTICGRFSTFSMLDNFQCLSIPVRSKSKKRTDRAEQILQWWNGIELSSIKCALDYSHVFHTDIFDCYSSIYTHSIAWALHGRDEAKMNRCNGKLIGNIIDSYIQNMRHGQTNGIPQGSVLMDFIAEMVLGYADSLLSERLSNCLSNADDYKILRYRDDYRIFVNSTSIGEKILKCLTEILIELGLKLNNSKTTAGQPVISSALKADKMAFLRGEQTHKDPRKQLLVLHAHGGDFPNAGSLATALSRFHQRLIKEKNIRDPVTLISIAIDIACTSPRTFPFCVAIASKLFSYLSADDRKELIGKIHRKLMQLPNVGMMEIWLQRLSFPYQPNFEFNEPLCQLISGNARVIWNNDWISSEKLKSALNSDSIINKEELKSVAPIIQPSEVALIWIY